MHIFLQSSFIIFKLFELHPELGVSSLTFNLFILSLNISDFEPRSFGNKYWQLNLGFNREILLSFEFFLITPSDILL